jgi:hypothetical protein
VPHPDPARYRCGTKQLFLPKVPASAAPAQNAAPQVAPMRLLPYDRNAATIHQRLKTDKRPSYLSNEISS